MQCREIPHPSILRMLTTFAPLIRMGKLDAIETPQVSYPCPQVLILFESQLLSLSQSGTLSDFPICHSLRGFQGHWPRIW